MTETAAGGGPQDPGSVGWTEPQRVIVASAEQPLRLQAGGSLGPVELEYEVYGQLNADRSNVILICHALSGDAHAAGWDRSAAERGWQFRVRKPGWWDSMIGPGKPIDTQRWCVICTNVIGSCYGSTGPGSRDPATGQRYGLRFPAVTVEDWVQAQARLLDRLGIERLYAVVGGSLGGQQALEWALAFPDRVARCCCLAAAPRLSTMGLGFNAVARTCILNDPQFRDGDWYDHQPPAHGLAAARMLAHMTYLSQAGMDGKFGRRLQDKDKPDFGFGVEFAVESYLDYQGRQFVERFDANSYLYITRAMDYYDAAARWGGGDLVEACRRIRSRVGVVSFSSDWLYTSQQCREFATALTRVGTPVTYVDVESPYGHDAFLVEEVAVGRLLRGLLNSPEIRS